MRKSVAIPMMLLAGGGAAAAVLTAPVSLIELGVASAGISELMPALAPPLGLKAQLLLAGLSGVVATAIAALILPTSSVPDNEQKQSGRNEKGKAMGLGARIARFARGGAAAEDETPVQLRRADAHPDAPARAPIFASRDLGADAFENVVPHAVASAVEAAGEPLPMPRTPEPLPIEALRAEIARVTERQEARTPRPLPLNTHLRDSEDLKGLSLSELTQRLETGLARRGLSAPAPVVEAEPTPSATIASIRPIIPEPPLVHQDDAQADSDAALQTALAALRSITAKAG